CPVDETGRRRGITVGIFYFARGRGPKWELSSAIMPVVCTLWFATCLLLTILGAQGGSLVWALESTGLALTLLFPALIMQSGFDDSARLASSSAGGGRRLSSWWAVPSILGWLVGIGTAAVAIPGFYGVFGDDQQGLRVTTIVIVGVLFVVAAIHNVFLSLWFKPRDESNAQRRTRGWEVALFGVMVVLFVLVALSSFSIVEFSGLLELAARSLPLAFLVVNVYYLDRFHFFDRIVKRGVFTIAATGLVATALWALPVLLRSAGVETSGVWPTVLVLLPVAL